jgi:hypothetical protein
MNFAHWNLAAWNFAACFGAYAAPATALVKYPARCPTFDLVRRGTYRPRSSGGFDFRPTRATATP